MDMKEKVSSGFGSQLSKTAADVSSSLLILLMKSIPFSLVDHRLLQHVLLGLRFSELSWDHSYPEEEGDSHILWLEFDGEEDGTPVNKLLKIYSKQVK